MRLPWDLGGDELVRLLSRWEYEPTRQTGSHLRLTRRSGSEEHHITIPRHADLKVGTLSNILKEVAEQLGMSKEELMEQMWP